MTFSETEVQVRGVNFFPFCGKFVEKDHLLAS
jgi:hypothetical protein